MRKYFHRESLQKLFVVILILLISASYEWVTRTHTAQSQTYLPSAPILLASSTTTSTPASVLRSPTPTTGAPRTTPQPFSPLALPPTLGIKPTGWLTSTALVAVLKPAATAPVSSTVAPTVTVTLPPTPTLVLQPTPDGATRTAKVPILMYHYLSTPPQDADPYRLDLSVKPELFAAQLDRMQAEHYTTISLYDLLANLTQGKPLPAKPVIITFDDGYRDSYENAFPLLQARGMKATFFVITDFIDQKLPDYLTWPMAREMLAAGMSIESHSRNHASLRKRDHDFLVWQALGSLETIKFELGVQPRFICYPGGEYDQATIDIFKSANYWGGITTLQGATQRSDDLFELHRVRIRGTTSADELSRLLALDW